LRFLMILKKLIIMFWCIPQCRIQYQGRLYKYQGIPFNLNNTLKVFTQIIKKIIHAVKKIKKIRCVIYLNNLLILHQNPNRLKIITPQITQSGLNYQFREIEPNPINTWVGCEIPWTCQSTSQKKKNRIFFKN
jgi:hypothetical protein